MFGREATLPADIVYGPHPTEGGELSPVAFVTEQHEKLREAFKFMIILYLESFFFQINWCPQLRPWTCYTHDWKLHIQRRLTCFQRKSGVIKMSVSCLHIKRIQLGLITLMKQVEE